MATTNEHPIRFFASAQLWEAWLQEDQPEVAGVWLKIAKKATGIPSVTYDQALDIALCYGWIDGQRKRYDEHYFLQKFTPRRAKSLWSKRNIEKIAQLTTAGRMQPAGLAEVEAAKRDGRWDAAYDSPKNMRLPEDFVQALGENEAAHTYFQTLSKSTVYTIALQLATAKRPETRKRRFDKLLAMLERGEFQ